MTSEKQASWPVPLKERDIGLGKAVREYAHSTEAVGHEPAAYERVLERMAAKPRRPAMLRVGLGMGTVAVGLATMVVLHQGARTAPQGTVPVVSTLPAPPSSPKAPQAARAPIPTPATPMPLAPAPAAPPATGAAFHLVSTPSALPAGKVELGGEGSAMVSADTVASARTEAGRTEIALGQGDIELHVLPRAPGRDFVVSAGDYRFMVVGTAFTVSRSEAHLALSVREGKVAVWRKTDRLTTVGAGGQWSVPLTPAAAARPKAARVQAEPPAIALRAPIQATLPALDPSPSRTAGTVPGQPPVAPASLAPIHPNPVPASQPAADVHRDCRAIAGRSPQEAMTCYQQQASQGGLAGEAAQYEIARLWRDSLHDPARALAAFREQRARFPRGALDIEADLSIIELLPRLDRHAEALAESERFLKAHPGAERQGELHLLRGNIFREAMHDFAHAEREYALGSETRGRAGDENRFLRAVCLETLGRTPEARAAYETYVSHPKAAHAADAKRRLERLGP